MKLGPVALNWELATTWFLPLAFVLGGALLGFLLEKLVIRRLTPAAGRLEMAWDDILVRSLRRAPTLLLTAVGAWAATQLLPLAESTRSILEDILTVLVIWAVTIVAARAAVGAVTRYAAQQRTPLPESSLVRNIAKFAVLGLGVLLILANLGVNVTALVTGLGIGGLAVALALQPTLANAFAGFQIIATRQVRDGDYVRLEAGEEGYVVDIRWRNTTIKALFDDYEIIVPNSKLSDSIVVNYDLPERPYWVRIDVGVSYGSDLERVEAVTREVADGVWREVATPREGREPVFRYREFGESAILFSVRILADEFADQFRIRHEFVKRLQGRFAEEGIVIPWPIRTLHVPDSVGVRLDEGAGPDPGSGGDSDR